MPERRDSTVAGGFRRRQKHFHLRQKRYGGQDGGRESLRLRSRIPRWPPPFPAFSRLLPPFWSAECEVRSVESRREKCGGPHRSGLVRISPHFREKKAGIAPSPTPMAPPARHKSVAHNRRTLRELWSPVEAERVTDRRGERSFALTCLISA